MATDAPTPSRPKWPSRKSRLAAIFQRADTPPNAPPPAPLDVLDLSPEANRDRLIARMTWIFVAIGISLRLVRFLLRPPIWGDEAFVAASFIDRGYLDLMRPLEYHQVVPLGFLWIELSIVKLLGFTEWSLRLVPTFASLASVVLFRHVAARVLRGAPLMLAVGIFAVAYYPIRHGNEVKPYSIDLLAALALLAMTIEWLRTPERRAWLWGLAAAAPVSVAVSHPAVFVAGGISLALAPAIWKARDARATLAYMAFNFALVASFLAMFALVTSAQYETEFGGGVMREAWKQAFPPLDNVLTLGRWLLQSHTSHMFAYPMGGARGASSLTTLCVIVAAVVLWRRRQRTLLALLLMPMLLTLAASLLKRYPYGGSARTMQFIAPALCLMAGLGAATLLAQFRNPKRRTWAVGAAAGLLVLIGAGSLIRDFARPYKTIYDQRARDFSRWFWNDQAHDAQLVCSWSDLGEEFYPGCFEWGNSARYQCNRRFYAPAPHPELAAPTWNAISPERPLRCAVYSMPVIERDEEAFANWMRWMRNRFDLVSRQEYIVNADSDMYRERYELFEFVPKASAAARDTNGSPMAGSP